MAKTQEYSKSYFSLSLDLFDKYEVSIRYIGMLVLGYAIGIFTDFVQILAFSGYFFIHAAYFFLALSNLGHSLASFVYKKGEQRDVVNVVAKSLYLVLQLAISFVSALSMFSMAMLKGGVLSSAVIPRVRNLFSVLLNDVNRSGAMYANIAVGSIFKNGNKIDLFNSEFSNPKWSSFIAASFLALTLLVNHTFYLSICAVPHLLLSAFYCVDLFNALINVLVSAMVHKSENDGVPLKDLAGFVSNLFSLATWFTIFRLSLNALMLSTPVKYAHHVLSVVPDFLIAQCVNSPTIASAAVLATTAEATRCKIDPRGHSKS
jgi:hypothetical protein